LQGGYVEIRYWRMGDSADTYSTIKALGTDTQAYLPGVRVGSQYVIVARAASVVTQSQWTSQVFVVASGKANPPPNITSLAATIIHGAVFISWDLPSNADYGQTELRIGASWAAGTPLSGSKPTRVRGASFLWAWPALAAYTIWAKQDDWSGNESATAASVSITVDGTINLGTGQLGPGAATGIYQATRVSSITWSSSE
jgi:hypothetical protein